MVIFSLRRPAGGDASKSHSQRFSGGQRRGPAKGEFAIFFRRRPAGGAWESHWGSVSIFCGRTKKFVSKFFLAPPCGRRVERFLLLWPAELRPHEKGCPKNFFTPPRGRRVGIALKECFKFFRTAELGTDEKSCPNKIWTRRMTTCLLHGNCCQNCPGGWVGTPPPNSGEAEFSNKKLHSKA